MDEPAKNDSENGGIDDYGNVIVTGKELADVLALSKAHVLLSSAGTSSNRFELTKTSITSGRRRSDSL